MTKQDFELIAHIIDTTPLPKGIRVPLAEEFANRLQIRFPKFNRSKFLKASTNNPAS